MELDNQKGYIIIDFLFTILSIIGLLIIAFIAYKITNHNIKSLLYATMVILGIISHNNIKTLKKELSE